MKKKTREKKKDPIAVLIQNAKRAAWYIRNNPEWEIPDVLKALERAIKKAEGEVNHG